MTGPAEERWYALLGPAFAAAHRALNRLDDDEVPAALRPVRAASMRRSLPRPLVRILARHLEEDWLRRLAEAEMEAGDSASVQASGWYLSRQEGWEQQIDGLVEERRARVRSHEAEEQKAEIERLRRRVDEVSERLRRSEGRVDELERELASDERAESLHRRVDEEIRARRRLEATIAEKNSELERSRSELAEADDRIAVLRTRMSRDATPRTDPTAGDRTFGRGRPVETARLLDELVEALRPRRGDVPTTEPMERLHLPPGVRPDSPEAIDWIRSVERPLLFVVDGHNVAHDLDPEPGRVIRDRIVSEVARLRRLTDGALAAIVFFDTVHEAERHMNAGVSVRYVDDADAAIEEVAAAADTTCVVVSTDRGVQTRVTAHGAIALWGTALSGWIRRR